MLFNRAIYWASIQSKQVPAMPCKKVINLRKAQFRQSGELPHPAQGPDVTVAERPEAGFGIDLRS